MVVTYKAIFQDFCDVFSWSYEEMSGIDPDITVHEIKTYPDAKPIRKRLRSVHPRKSTAIKLEVEKILNVGFIYPVALTDWVSNLVTVNKKQGAICVCANYRDINKYFPKDNYPTPFIDHIIDNCAEREIFSLIDCFSDYTQINIFPVDQHETNFICPWGNFAYHKLPFGLNNTGVTFQRAIYYYFHDINHIVQSYLDDLLVHSMRHQDHPAYLRAIFLYFRYYHICLNPYTCFFCVESSWLLGFIMSLHGIRVDPLKVEAILNLPRPSTLLQLQSLQGKENVFHRFIPNYVELTEVFTQLLKKGYKFVWDDTASKPFASLKLSLTCTPLFFPLDYSQDYLL
jgi:hypothetical protein